MNNRFNNYNNVSDLSPTFYYFNKNKLSKQSIKNKNDIFSPLSGSEPKFTPKSWNPDNIRLNHNCYSYAIDSKHSGRKGKPQPGYFSGYEGADENNYNCKSFYKRLIKDLPSMYLTNIGTGCKKGFHKVFFALDAKKHNPDYHFYRQDKTGLWSHKPGITKITQYDSEGNLIINPEKAKKKSDYFDYNIPCYYFCVNPKLSRAHATRLKRTNNFLNLF